MADELHIQYHKDITERLESIDARSIELIDRVSKMEGRLLVFASLPGLLVSIAAYFIER